MRVGSLDVCNYHHHRDVAVSLPSQSDVLRGVQQPALVFHSWQQFLKTLLLLSVSRQPLTTTISFNWSSCLLLDKENRGRTHIPTYLLIFPPLSINFRGNSFPKRSIPPLLSCLLHPSLVLSFHQYSLLGFYYTTFFFLIAYKYMYKVPFFLKFFFRSCLMILLPILLFLTLKM